jgi:hypothetical protein
MNQVNEEIEQLNQLLVMEFVSYYARIEENIATQDLYDEQPDATAQSIFMDTAMRGKKIIEAYQTYVSKTKSLFELSYKEMEECLL